MIRLSPVSTSIFFALIGSAIYALLAFNILFPQPVPAFGTDIYDAYFYRLLEGRFDIPLRILRFEGHYAADGTGILYHGIPPLLTRALLYPFVTLHTFPTAAFSVWLWSSIGAAFFHALAFQVLRRYAGSVSVGLSLTLAIAIWIASPGFLLSSTLVLYHEPLSVSFAATAGALYLFLRVALLDVPIRRVLLPAAMLAALVLHARPHMALGIYAGICFLILLMLKYDPKRSLLRGAATLLILGVAGLSYLELNKTRFGSAVQIHGDLGDATESQVVQYAPVFFGSDYAVDGRGVIFNEHGWFHPWRVLPNTFIYTFDAPPFADQVAAIHGAMTEPVSGRGFIEAPRFGMVFIWSVWVIAAILGLIFARPRFVSGLTAIPPLLGAGVAAVFMLSYPTIAFRYRFEVWPLLFTIALLCLPGFLNRFGKDVFVRPTMHRAGVLALTIAVSTSFPAAYDLARSYRTFENTKHGPWDEQDCLSRIVHHEFSDERNAFLCADPETVYIEWKAKR